MFIKTSSRIALVFLCCFLSIVLPTTVLSQTISTFAGGYLGDGEAATSAYLSSIGGFALDNASNIYFTDTKNHRIRKVDAATGIITTVAGRHYGFAGDGGPATQALFDSPSGIAIVGESLFIADNGNLRIRKINMSTGIVTTVAGNGTFGASPDGVPASSPLELESRTNISADSRGNVYYPGKNGVRRINLLTNSLTTAAGTGQWPTSFAESGAVANSVPIYRVMALAVDRNDDLFFTETNLVGTERICKVDATTGVLTVVAGGGTAKVSDGEQAASISIRHVTSLAIDAQSNIYFTGVNPIPMTSESYIARINATDQKIAMLAGRCINGGTCTTAFEGHGVGDNPGPRISVNSAGDLFFSSNSLIRKKPFDSSVAEVVVGVRQLINLYEDGIAVEKAIASAPLDLKVDGNNNVYFVEANGLRKVDAASRTVSTITSSICTTCGFDVDTKGDVYFAYRNPSHGVPSLIMRLRAESGSFEVLAGEGTQALTDGVAALDVDFIRAFGQANLKTIVLSAQDEIYFAVHTLGIYDGSPYINGSQLFKLENSTGVMHLITGTGKVGTTVYGNLDIAIISTFAMDNFGNIYLYDGRLMKIDAASRELSLLNDPALTTESGEGHSLSVTNIGKVSGLATDADNHLYISESPRLPNVATHRVLKVEMPSTTVERIAGTESVEFNGDGIPAADANLNLPVVGAFDRFGNLFVSETGNHRIRLIDNVGPITSAEETEGVAVTVYPNPTTASMTIDADANLIFAATIFSIEGKSVREKIAIDTPMTTVQHPVAHLAPGLYLLKVQTGKGMRMVKFVKY